MMKRAFESATGATNGNATCVNAPSRAAAQRLGLSFEGIFRQATVYKGRNRDTAWYAAIDTEWPALREAFLAWLAPANFDGQGQQRTRLSDSTRPILKQRRAERTHGWGTESLKMPSDNLPAPETRGSGSPRGRRTHCFPLIESIAKPSHHGLHRINSDPIALLARIVSRTE